MLDKLQEYFASITRDVKKDGDTLTARFYESLSNTDLIFNFNKHEYIVKGTVSESQYSTLFVVDEDYIYYDDFEAWIATDVYSDVNQALDRAQEIAYSYSKESGCIYACEELFTDAKKEITA